MHNHRAMISPLVKCNPNKQNYALCILHNVEYTLRNRVHAFLQCKLYTNILVNIIIEILLLVLVLLGYSRVIYVYLSLVVVFHVFEYIMNIPNTI